MFSLGLASHLWLLGFDLWQDDDAKGEEGEMSRPGGGGRTKKRRVLEGSDEVTCWFYRLFYGLWCVGSRGCQAIGRLDERRSVWTWRGNEFATDKITNPRVKPLLVFRYCCLLSRWRSIAPAPWPLRFDFPPHAVQFRNHMARQVLKHGALPVERHLVLDVEVVNE